MPIDQNEFRAALGRFASGVTIVTTTDADGNHHGITVSAFCSVSLAPPLVLICVEKTAGSHDALVQSNVFIINILNHTQAMLSDRFASQIIDKFDGIDFNTGLEGIPVLTDCLVNLECRRHNSYDGGDHTIFIGEVENVRIQDGRPLAYFHGNYRMLTD